MLGNCMWLTLATCLASSLGNVYRLLSFVCVCFRIHPKKTQGNSKQNSRAPFQGNVQGHFKEYPMTLQDNSKEIPNRIPEDADEGLKLTCQRHTLIHRLFISIVIFQWVNRRQTNSKEGLSKMHLAEPSNHSKTVLFEISSQMLRRYGNLS